MLDAPLLLSEGNSMYDNGSAAGGAGTAVALASTGAPVWAWVTAAVVVFTLGTILVALRRRAARQGG